MRADTIAAAITAPGQAAVAALRISGPEALAVAQRLIKHGERLASQPRRLQYSELYDLQGTAGSVLDHVLVAYFKAPHSFTGEEVVEFHVHGSPFVLRRLLDNLLSLGVRHAEPGEFTRRAFLNGRMDLSQAEGVADLIAAETEAQARVAEQQLSGRLSSAVNDLGEPLRDLLAEVEAYIDFPEEGIDPLAQDKWLEILKPLQAAAARYVRSFQTGKVFREGAKVVLAGLPNAGKSSLLNALSGEARAIVTPIPGTTRDSIEQRLDIGGLAVQLWDTAGLVDAGEERDEVERIGIERSWKLLDEADLVLFVFAPDADLRAQLRFLGRIVKRARKLYPLLNKLDTIDRARLLRLSEEIAGHVGEAPLAVSAETHEGLEALQAQLRERLIGNEDPQASLLICNRRHYEALLTAAEAFERVEHLLRSGQSEPEFVALELRAALGALQDIVGVTHTEDILGRIFSKFCIGK